MSILVYYAVREHLKERKLSFGLLAFQLGLDYGDIVVALMQLYKSDELCIIYTKNGEPIFYLKED